MHIHVETKYYWIKTYIFFSFKFSNFRTVSIRCKQLLANSCFRVNVWLILCSTTIRNMSKFAYFHNHKCKLIDYACDKGSDLAKLMGQSFEPSLGYSCDWENLVKLHASSWLHITSAAPSACTFLNSMSIYPQGYVWFLKGVGKKLLKYDSIYMIYQI